MAKLIAILLAILPLLAKKYPGSIFHYILYLFLPSHCLHGHHNEGIMC